MCELVGGEDKIDDVRERWYGDQLICNFGGDERWGTSGRDLDLKGDFAKLPGWHTDNDWYSTLNEMAGEVVLMYQDSFLILLGML